jgi:hypothetical protein
MRMNAGNMSNLCQRRKRTVPYFFTSFYFIFFLTGVPPLVFLICSWITSCITKAWCMSRYMLDPGLDRYDLSFVSSFVSINNDLLEIIVPVPSQAHNCFSPLLYFTHLLFWFRYFFLSHNFWNFSFLFFYVPILIIWRIHRYFWKFCFLLWKSMSVSAPKRNTKYWIAS